MKEEIKEILDYIDDRIIPNEKWNKIKDYITNLQEENKTLKELNVCVGCNNNPDYKQRNEKAIEYIEDSGITFLNLANQRCFCNNNCADKLLNILKGDKDE